MLFISRLALATAVLTALAPWAPAAPAGGADDWPQFLGPNRDGRSTDVIARELPADGPPALWRRPVGEGFAAPAVAGGRLLLFHRVADEEIVEALDAATGEPIWRAAAPTGYRDDFGFDEGPRASPTIVDGVVYTCGAEGFVQALRLADGARLWSVDTRTRFRPEKGFFGASCSPLVAADRVMINVGGADGTGIVGLDARSGEVVWTATDDDAGYAAPVVANFGNGPRALFFTRMGLVDVDPATGTVFASMPWRSRSRASVNAASPVVIGGRVFLSASYGTGAVMLERTPEGYRPVWSDDETLSSHYATSVHDRGTLYGYHGRQEYGPALRAVNATTGSVGWEVERFGAGSILIAGETLVLVRESGELVLADASPEAFRPLARARLVEPVVRAYPALAGGILYVRNERELAAFDLRPR